MSEKKARQAGWLYTFFYPNRAYRYNEEQRKVKRKDDDLKLSRVFVLVYVNTLYFEVVYLSLIGVI